MVRAATMGDLTAIKHMTSAMAIESEGVALPDTDLDRGVRTMLATPESWKALPEQVRDWLNIQQEKSVLPARDGLLVETFPRANKHYMVCYPFEGRLAHQTLGMLLTKRLERLGANPLGFVANDYALGIWGLGDLSLLFSCV